jgi:ribosomal protein S27AE
MIFLTKPHVMLCNLKRTTSDQQRILKHKLKRPTLNKVVQKELREDINRKKSNKNAKKLLNKIITELEDDTQSCLVTRNKNDVLKDNECPKCKLRTMTLDSFQKRCKKCGYTQLKKSISGYNSNILSYSEKVNVSSNSYRRFLHYKTNIKKRIPTGIVDKESDLYIQARNKIMHWLSNHNVKDSTYVTLKNVTEAGKKVGVKNNNLLLYLTEELSGVKLPIFSHLDMMEDYCMFQAMQEPFDLYKPVSRINFLHYNQTAFKFRYLKGEDKWLYVYFWPMKGQSKIDEYDELAKLIFDHHSLNWEWTETFTHENARKHYQIYFQENNL